MGPVVSPRAVTRKLVFGAVALVLLAAGLVTIAAWRSTQWAKAGNFRRSARCGMSLGEALELADATDASFGLSEERRDGFQVARAQKGRVAFLLHFQPTQGEAWLATGKLQAIQRLDYYGLSGVTAGPREPLCSAR